MSLVLFSFEVQPDENVGLVIVELSTTNGRRSKVMSRSLPKLLKLNSFWGRGFFQLNFYGSIALESGDATVIHAFETLKREADMGLEYEKLHGQWSLLKHDHPVTVRLKARGYYSDLKAF